MRQGACTSYNSVNVVDVGAGVCVCLLYSGVLQYTADIAAACPRALMIDDALVHWPAHDITAASQASSDFGHSCVCVCSSR